MTSKSSLVGERLAVLPGPGPGLVAVFADKSRGEHNRTFIFVNSQTKGNPGNPFKAVYQTFLSGKNIVSGATQTK